MDKVEVEKSRGSPSDDGNGATEVRENISRDNKGQNTAMLPDGTKGRSSRRKPNKTHRRVDSEDEDEDDDGEEQMRIEEYMHEKEVEGGYALASHMKTSAADSGADDGEEEIEEEEDVDEDEDEELERMELEEHPPHLPDGTVVVQPVAVEDSTPAFHPIDFPYGRKTTTDVIPDYVSCTACERRILTNSIDNFFRHPELKVLLCRGCFAVYQTKPIRTGDDGIDDACRWCAEGGDLICCDFCHNAFCKGCIERNLGRQELHAILNAGDNEKWHCYVCHPQLIGKHVEACNAITAAVEEREKVARRRQKPGATRSPRRNQLMPNKATQQQQMPDTAALASAIASQVMSANAVAVASTVRRGVGRPRGSRSGASSSKGDILYIRTPSGGVVGIPAKGMDQLANVPLPPGALESPAKARPTPKATRSPRAVGPRPQFANVPSLPMTSVTLSSTPPNINEYNVWAVLEKLLAATQSMGMLLGSLKDDLRRSGTTVVAMEQLKKRREVAMKLWRAFVAYKKSFLDIETFTRAGTTASQTTPQPARVGGGGGSKVSATAKSGGPATEKGEATERHHAEEYDDKVPDAEQSKVAVKRRSSTEEQSPPRKAVRLDSDLAAGHETEAKMEAGAERGQSSEGEDKSEDESAAAEKKPLFGSLHFEPLFEIKPMAKKD